MDKVNNKGVMFTLDSVLALGLVIALFVFVGLTFSITPEIRYRNIYTAAEDGMQVMTKLKVADVQPKVQDLIDDGYIFTDDLNKSVLEVIGTLWVGGNQSKAANLTQKIMGNVTKCYELTVLESLNETSIYKSCPSYGDNIAVASRLASGIERGKSVEGFVARAWATEVLKNATSYAYFGGFVGQGNISKNFTITGLDQVLETSMEMNAGSAFDLFINGNYSGSYTPTLSNLSADSWVVCNQTYSNNYCLNLTEGNNEVEFRFTGNESFIGGGLLRVIYNSTLPTTPINSTHYFFPGIEGLANIFSSFYVPGTLHGIDVFLHYESNYTMFLTLGNTTIWEDDSGGVEDSVWILDPQVIGNLSSVNFTYGDFSQSTIPLRLGLRNVSYIIVESTPAHVVLSTDVSGSMAGSKIAEAREADKEFATILLENPDNNVGLNNYSYYIEASEPLTNDNVHLNRSIDAYNDDGGTCICCGINSGVFTLLDGRTGWTKAIDSQVSGTFVTQGGDYTDTALKDNSYWYIGSPNADVEGNMSLNFSISGLGITETNVSALSILFNYCHDGSNDVGACTGDSAEGTPQGIQDFFAYNFTSNKWVDIGDLRTNDGGRTVTSNFQIGDVSVAPSNGGDVSGTFSNNGGNHSLTQSEDQTYFYFGGVNTDLEGNMTLNFSIQTLGISQGNITNMEIFLNYCHDGSEDVGACTGDAAEGDVQGNQDVFVFNYSTNNWADIGDLRTNDGGNDVSDSYILPGNVSHLIDPSGNVTIMLEAHYTVDESWNDQWLVIDYASLDITHTQSTNPGHFIEDSTDTVSVMAEISYIEDSSGDDSWLVVDYAAMNVTYPRGPDNETEFIVVMSDGDATEQCGEQGTGSDSQDAINAACDAQQNYNMTVHAVGFGTGANNATLQSIADCGGGQYFYADAGGLSEIFRQLANQILNATFEAQFIVAGEEGDTTLYPDSHIKFNFTHQNPLNPGELSINLESDKFGGNSTSPQTGTFSIPNNTRAVEARVTSYSAEYWTDSVNINNISAYILSKYGSDYTELGDPYIVDIPISLVNETNNSVSVDTAFGPGNTTGGSPDSRVIYTVGIGAAVGYGNIFNNQTDANTDAQQRLNQSLSQYTSLIQFDVELTPTGIGGIPGLWGPATFTMRVWE